jgi:crotonobetaine/carnitine-CoA ligase
VLVALTTKLQPDERDRIIEHSGARIILAGGDHLSKLAASANTRRRDGPHVITIGHGTSREFEELEASSPETPQPIRSSGGDPVSLVYTSGTTGGTPKAVVQTHANYVLTGEAFPRWLNLESGDRLFACLPLFHINAQAYSVMSAIGTRGSLALTRRFSASGFWKEVVSLRANTFNFVGSMLAILDGLPPSPEERNHDVRVSYGAPALPNHVRERLEERFAHTILFGFGMSETTFGLIEDIRAPRAVSSMGRPRTHPDPLFRAEARIVDAAGSDVAPDVPGELVLRSPAVMKEYFEDVDATEAAVRQGWLHTGDIVRRDAAGLYHFVGRKKDIVRHRGENVSAPEVETVLAEHPDVLEAAVVGVPSELYDEEILALVVPRPEHALDPAALLTFAAASLAPFKVPRYVQVVDNFPRTPSMKIAKDLVKAQLVDPSSWHDRASPARDSAVAEFEQRLESE